MEALDFWGKLSKVFPAVRRVILSGCVPRKTLLSLPLLGEAKEKYAVIETVVGCAPPQIVAHVALKGNKTGRRPRKYVLWQVPSSSEQSWQALDKDWRPTRILLPARKWPASPLGDLMTFTRRNSALVPEIRGLKWLEIESYITYAVDGIIRCPRLYCDAKFSTRNEWSQHIQDAQHE